MFFFFFFSSRRRHTRLQGDWSSDVCSSDLVQEAYRAEEERAGGRGSQRKDEAGEAFGEPRQRKTAPEQEGSEQAALAPRDDHEAEQRDGEPENEEGVGEEEPPVEEGARRGREDERRQRRRRGAEKLAREEERDRDRGDVRRRARHARRPLGPAEQPVRGGHAPVEERRLLIVTDAVQAWLHPVAVVEHRAGDQPIARFGRAGERSLAELVESEDGRQAETRGQPQRRPPAHSAARSRATRVGSNPTTSSTTKIGRFWTSSRTRPTYSPSMPITRSWRPKQNASAATTPARTGIPLSSTTSPVASESAEIVAPASATSRSGTTENDTIPETAKSRSRQAVYVALPLRRRSRS